MSAFYKRHMRHVKWDTGIRERHVRAGLFLATLPLLPEVAGVHALRIATRPWLWAGWNLYKEGKDLVHWAKGGEMEWAIEPRARPYILSTGVPIAIPFPWIELSAKDSTGGGGPSESPTSTTPGRGPRYWPRRPDRPGGSPPVIIESSKKTTRSRKRCPPGHFWNGRRCVKIPKATAYDKRFIKKWSKKR